MVSVNDLFLKTFEKLVKNVSNHSWTKIFSGSGQNGFDSVMEQFVSKSHKVSKSRPTWVYV